MLTRHSFPILEYSDQREAVVDTTLFISPVEGFPRACVLAFTHEAVEMLVEREQLERIGYVPQVVGDLPLYRARRGETDIALLCCPAGAPSAVDIMEKLRAMGGELFLSYGGVGVLDRNIHVGGVLLPERALREEGASYHYLPPARFVEADRDVLRAVEETLAKQEIPYQRTATWTTDARCRETREKVELRRAEGCLCVEMEVAGLMAAAQFRGLHYGALLYGGDNLDGDIWDKRGWDRQEIRLHLLEITLLCAARAAKEVLP